MIDFKQKMEELEKKEGREILSEEDGFHPVEKKKKRRITSFTVVLLVLALVFSGKVIMSSQSTTDWLEEKGFLSGLRRLVPSGDKVLAGEDEDRINILLLGMGGAGHDGAYLTDTIILASIKPSTHEVVMVSIPRDLTIPIENSGWRKINNVNAFAEAKGNDGGEASKEALSQVFNLPIHYYIRADFQGFINIIDELGGVEVNVENTLDDYSYPILGQEDNPDYYARYEHLHIEEGVQKMDGSLALKYARSRHAYGIEGSDFARARRQQLVIEAVKDKLLSRQTLLNPVTLGKLINQFEEHIDTDLEVWEMLKLWNVAKEVNREKINNVVLSDAPDSYLVASMSEETGFILSPKTGNFGKIRSMLQDVFKSELDEEKSQDNPLEAEDLIIKQEASVAVLNGTWISGLASEIASDLEKFGFNIFEIENAALRDHKDSIIYDLSYGDKNEALYSLEKITNAKQSFAFPDWISEYEEVGGADFILVLGTDSN